MCTFLFTQTLGKCERMLKGSDCIPHIKKIILLFQRFYYVFTFTLDASATFHVHIMISSKRSYAKSWINIFGIKKRRSFLQLMIFRFFKSEFAFARSKTCARVLFVMSARVNLCAFQKLKLAKFFNQWKCIYVCVRKLSYPNGTIYHLFWRIRDFFFLGQNLPWNDLLVE